MAQNTATSGVRAGRGVRAAAADDDYAGLGARVVSFLLDSLILLAFVMAFAAAGFLFVFISTDSGREGLKDWQAWAMAAILMLTVPAWLAFNLFLMSRRAQTVGQYIVGLKVVREDGGQAGMGQVALHWMALHPLLFHPFLVGFWGLSWYLALALAGRASLMVLIAAFAILCLIAPLIAFVSALTNTNRRALHDRIAALKVVRLE